jgi:phosphoglycerate dehydrogenase-like enzyme
LCLRLLRNILVRGGAGAAPAWLPPAALAYIPHPGAPFVIHHSSFVIRVPRLVLNLRDVRPIWAIPDWAVEEIRAALPAGWEVVAVEGVADGRGDGGGAAAEVLDAVRGAEVYMGYGAPRELFLAATEPPEGRLRWIHSGAAGVGGALYPEMVRSEVLLTNSAGIHAPPIAESVLAMVLHFARGFDFAVRAQARRRWHPEPFEAADAPVREVSGAGLGVVGLGGIGTEVAWRAAALGMRVVATRRTPAPAPAHLELLTGDDALPRLLARSEFLVLCVPETAATWGLIGRAELERLPHGAVVINVARGRVLDEEALIDLLRAGRLRGAGLDVFSREPLPPDSPLWELPGVLITPHVSATSRGFWRRETDLILDNLRRYLAGQPLRNLVDKQAGY